MSAFALRLLACVAMLLDHIGYNLGGAHPLYLPLRCIGRLAFPIFVFLIVNGFRHTANRPRYALRLALSAVISQIPFSLFCRESGFLANGNVFFTLLLCLLVVWAADALRAHGLKWLMPLPALVAFVPFYFGFLRADYGAKGILLAMSFYLFADHRVAAAVGTLLAVTHRYLLALALALLHLVQGRPAGLAMPSQWELVQLLSLAALLPIFLYNGKKGFTPRSPAAAKALQLGFYLFYPAHLLALLALR